MISNCRQLCRKVKDKPSLELLQILFSKMGMDFSPFYWVQEGIFKDSHVNFGSKFDDYSCDFLLPEEIPTLLELDAWQEYSPEKLASMFKAGKKCISTRYRGRIAAFMWIDLEESNCKWYRFPLKEDEAYLFDMFTLKEFRGRGIAPFLRYKSYEILEKIGRTKCYSYSDYYNNAAIKFKKKLNAKFLKVGLYFAISKSYRWIWDKDVGAKDFRFRSLGKTFYCFP